MKHYCPFDIMICLTFIPLMQIVWPDHWAPGSPYIPVFLLSVDGVHCRIQEPKHPTVIEGQHVLLPQISPIRARL